MRTGWYVSVHRQIGTVDTYMNPFMLEVLAHGLRALKRALFPFLAK